MKHCIGSCEFLIINAVRCSSGSDLAFSLLYVAVCLFCSLLSGIFHQKTAVKYFSRMKFMKNTRWLQVCLNYGIYQTGIYFFFFCTFFGLHSYSFEFICGHSVLRASWLWSDLLMAMWGSSWALLSWCEPTQGRRV